ncbi:TonB-dependent receptor [uncultured Phocaeicola sp.]|uniref:SusC/RagA family TonB-linked outer membrane protein n=2 Tax=uncultured Phocaeicola sp. TaxID=990718 RepID=UPI002583F48C|nr:TonB-dependent receptor [uncultured Phocaeicola sp.]
MLKRVKSVSMLLFLMAASTGSMNAVSAPAMASSNAIEQQTGICKGIVKDATGETVIGASVVVKGTTNGTITGIDGDFTLSGVPKGSTLVISFVGYVTQEIKFNGQALDIVLKEDSKTLDEVVVVGYGVQKKVNLTGSVTAVGPEELTTHANTNLLATVQGQVPGVTIISRPGSDPAINMRGRGNLGTSAPLFVVDGAIADAGFFSSLDPNSIESISFLKDAASSAIYGSRAAYGVVLVKTKGGKEGKVKVSYDGTVSLKFATYTPKVLGSEWYARLSNEAALNENPNTASLPYTEEAIQKFRDGSDPDMYPNTNWYDLVLDDQAVMTKHSVSISGGNKVKYYTSLGYMYDDKFTPGSSSNRYNLISNLSSDVNDWLSWRSNINYIQNTSDTETGGIAYVNLLTIPSTYVARQSNGEWGSYEGGKPAALVNMQRNPLRQLEEGGWNKSKSENTLINLAVDIKPIKGLVLTGEMIYKAYDYKYRVYEANRPKIKDFVTGAELNSTNTDSKMTYDWQENSRLTYNGLANYTWSNDIHSIGVLGGISYEHYQYQKQKSYRKKFPTNGMTDINGGSSAPEDMHTEGGTNEDKLMSYFARVNYSYKDRYLFEANLRADASSRFHKDNRWGIFPSFSAGWRVNQEEFMKDIHWINNLKIRASWGQLGNINNVGQYDYFSTYEQGDNYNFEDTVVNGIIEAKPANVGLGWETVTVTNIGVDFDIFNGLLSFTGDYYDKQTKDILMSYPSPAEVGIPSKYKVSQNIGKVSNKGIEIAITHNNRIGDFSYSIGGNITKNWNKVKDLGVNDPMIEDPWIKKVGYAIGTFYGYRSDGLLTQEDIDNGNYITDGNSKPNAGDIKYVDLDGDKKLTDKDRDYIGCDVPDITYGINLSMQYKGFDLSVFGQGVSGTKVRFYQEQAWAFSDYASPREYHLKRWTVENPNPNAAYPRIYPCTSAHSTFNNKFSDFWLFDADYFRIKNITLGYTFQKNVVQSLGVEALKLYVAAENPFTIRADHRMEDFDPETASGRGENTRGTTSLSFGVNLTF